VPPLGALGTTMRTVRDGKGGAATGCAAALAIDPASSAIPHLITPRLHCGRPPQKTPFALGRVNN